MKIGPDDPGPVVVEISGTDRLYVHESGVERDYSVEAVPYALWCGPLTPPEAE